MYFFVPDLQKTFVEKEEGEHFWSCRTQINKIYKICDQKGTVAKIKITKMDKKSTRIEFEILEKNYISLENWIKINQKNVKVLFQAQIDKGYLEKWAEILPFGFWSKVFIFASEFSPKQNLNLERLNRILTRSTEQSENFYKPKIEIINKKNLFEIIQKKVQKENFIENEFENKSKSKPKNKLENDFKNKFEPSFENVEFGNVKLENEIINKFVVLDTEKTLEKLTKKLKNLDLNQLSIFNSETKNNLDNLALNMDLNNVLDNVISNFVIGPEGGFSEAEKQIFADFGCQFKTFGQIIYPSWLATFLIR